MPLAKRIATLLRVLTVALLLLVVVSFALAAYLYRMSLTLPDLRVDPDSLKTARTSIVYAADDSVLAEWHGEEDRTLVPFDKMPLVLRNAVVAIEDKRFYQHDGVDLESVGRALRINTQAGQVEQGGSTITQQLIKILFTGRERSITRKVREALLAYELESKNDKDKVLEIYLNTVYFGRGSYGVESAARCYFGKPASDLTLSESATLAGIIRSPSRYGLTTSMDLTAKRRNLVLAQMREQGYIADKEERLARAEPLVFAPSKEAGQVAPYFVEYVKQNLIERLGSEMVYGGGLRVYTTLEPELQAIAEAATLQLSAAGDPEVALVTVRPADGWIVAMVGGRDFRANQFNIASQGRRQPGSAFKPFVMVAALEQGVRPDTQFDASPYSVRVTDGIWNVANYENRFTAGAMTLQAATNFSVNAVYARLVMKIGPDKVVDVAKRMGITAPLTPNPAIALGGLKYGVSPLEMASAYGTLANGGVRVVPSAIIKVTDDRDRPVFEQSTEATRAIKSETAVQASLMLNDVIERGTGSEAKGDVWAAGKTGTTQSYRDAWFVGWAGDLSTAVWVGHRSAQVPMTNVHGINVTGGSFPATIWREYMARATKVRSAPVTPADPAAPAGEVLCVVCSDSMLLANKRCSDPVEIYLNPALVPKPTCTLH